MNPEPYSTHYAVPVAQASGEARAKFIRRTYVHLAVAILAFIQIEYILFGPLFESFTGPLLSKIFGAGGMGWLVVLGVFMVVGWIADRWARSETSKGMQYFGLGLYVLAEAIIFAPLLYIAQQIAPGGELIAQAGVITLLLFAGLTATVFITKKDFSFLGPIIGIGFMIGFGVIIAGILFGFNLGLFFSAAMVILAAGAILYTTSNILHHYHEQQYVAASLALFAAVALLFWYILRILIALQSSD